MSYESKIGSPWKGYYITAYGIAVKHGFTGTEEEWLESLNGAPGAPVEMRFDEVTGELQWRIEGETGWRTLLTLEDIQGEVIEQTLNAADAARTAAEAARDAAQAAKDAAQSAQEVAEASESAAGQSATDAEESAQSAAQSAVGAAQSATSAGNSATGASNSASNAQTSETNAQSYAQGAQEAQEAAESARDEAESAESLARSAMTAAQAAAGAAASSATAAETSSITAISAAADAQTAKNAAEGASAQAQASESTASGHAATSGTNATAAAQSAAEARGEKQAAETAAGNASAKATESKSWAVGGTGTRTGEDTNNAKYWSDVAQGAAGGGVSSFNGRSGAVVPAAGDYTAAMVGAETTGAVSTHDSSGTAHSDIRDTLGNKVDKVSGKALSTNDYTTSEKNKLSGIAAGAEANVQSDWNATSGDAYIKNKPSSLPASDVSAWAKAATKPTYTANEVGADAAGSADAVQAELDSHDGNSTKHITAAERATWNAKQNALAFDSTPTSGSANPVTSGGVHSGLQAKANASHTHDTRYYTETETDTMLGGKLDKSGGTMTGALTLSGQPTANLHAATKQYVDEHGGMKPQIVVSAPTGSTVSCSKGSVTLTAAEVSGTWTFNIPDYGVWTVNAAKSGDSDSTGVTVDQVKQYAVTMKYVSIYGVEWDGTASTVWSRTDDAQSFANPTPYVAGSNNYGSPFDNLMPWSGMTKTTDSAAGTLVAIPKFWYKWTKSGNTLKLQIADKAESGFSVSPAHMDRGDGKGERSTVYIGRYHCHTSNFKSQTGGRPKASVTRSDARTGIHNLGSTIWQTDFAMRVTLWMLYLVEFADWNSQKTIGKGCGNNSATENMGYTDSMPYHTGTTQSNRDNYGLGTQYRNIEGLWDNVFDWCDGCYYNSSGLNIIMNPSSFHDSSGGTLAGLPTGGWPSALNVSTANGLGWVIYPSAAAGSETTYVSDNWNFDASNPCLFVGGSYGQGGNCGLFCVYCSGSSYANGSIGCRLQKLP